MICSDFCWSLVTGNAKSGKDGELEDVETKLEWLLNGPVIKNESTSANLSFVNENTSHVLFSKKDQFTDFFNSIQFSYTVLGS